MDPSLCGFTLDPSMTYTDDSLLFPDGTNVGTADPQRQDLVIPFQVARRGPCTVFVQVEPDRDADINGKRLMIPAYSAAQMTNFPLCTARVVSPVSRGYASMYGWVQVTRDAPTAAAAAQAHWKHDPIPITARLNTPFCWFGPEPTLFDGPLRVGTQNIDWTARSFLTYIDDCLMSTAVRPVLAFEWGFEMKDGLVALKQLRQLGLDAWNEQTPFLRRKFPSWFFVDSNDSSMKQ